MGWIVDLLKEIPTSARFKFELEQMATENAALKIENAALKAEVANLRDIIKQRDNALEQEKKKLHDSVLDEVREKILLFVANHPELTDQQIASGSQASELIAMFHLQELKKLKLVTTQHTAGSDWLGTSASTNWSISQQGLAYLIQRSLIQ